jgi:rfaE bifunctional protein nucleotidyltransferase chain/domain/rfaE bifunctional protein kinase chain/domain
VSVAGCLVVVGDTLLDRDVDGTITRLAPDAPAPVVDVAETQARPGGAGLAASLARAFGHEVVLVTALAEDDDAAILQRLLTDAGVTVVPLALSGATPTKTRVRSGRHVVARLDQPRERGGIGAVTPQVVDALSRASVVLVSDYGRGITARRDVRRLLTGVPSNVPIVWDPHPLGSTPVRGTRLLTPNEREASVLGGAGRSVEDAARAILARLALAGVAVTRGQRGAVLVVAQGPPLVIPAPSVVDNDACGAGDAFAAAAATALGDGDVLGAAIERAVHTATEFVASGAAGSWPHLPTTSARTDKPSSISTRAAAVERANAVRANGGRVVATSGCFDLLHAGHVGMLRAARSLGDHLVVLVNSDDSVRRLKGPGRPLQPAADRAELLAGLRVVDEVIVFDEDTPAATLQALRPDVFVKGGDYAFRDLPETEAMRSFGGEVVVVPYVSGRSTTELIERSRVDGASL